MIVAGSASELGGGRVLFASLQLLASHLQIIHSGFDCNEHCMPSHIDWPPLAEEPCLIVAAESRTSPSSYFQLEIRLNFV